MFKNYLIVAIRNIFRHRFYSFITISGLIVGMTCCILIMRFIQYELSYDQFHKHSDLIYRVTLETFQIDGTKLRHYGRVGAPVGELLQADFPELKITRINTENNVLKSDRASLYKWVFYTDPQFLDIFTFPLIAGDPATALKAPFSIVITKKIAQLFFADSDPIGQELQFGGSNYTVTGILKEIPSNTHFDFDILASYSTLTASQSRGGWFFEAWVNSRHSIYIQLPESYTQKRLSSQLPSFVTRHREDKKYQLHLQPLTDIHLHPLFLWPRYQETERRGNMTYILIYATIGILILSISCINFINLSMARSGMRTREVGLRKVVGAKREELVAQFLCESIFLAFIALPIAFACSELALPAFASLVGSSVAVANTIDVSSLFGFFLITLCVGLVAGSYPAFILSGFQPIEALQSRLKLSKANFRNVLVILQFATTIILIISTSVVYNQLEFSRNQELGFDKDQVLLISRPGISGRDYERIRQRFLQNPNVLSIATSDEAPAGGGGGQRVQAEVGYKAKRAELTLFIPSVDYGFLKTYGIEILSGRDFSEAIPSDLTQATIVNEEAIRNLGFGTPEEAIGQPLKVNNWSGTIIGVIKDFHFASMHEPIHAVSLRLSLDPKTFAHLSIKIHARNIPYTLAFLEQEWRNLLQNRPFEYTFIDDAFDRLYRQEQRQGLTLAIFSSVAVFLSCWGLLGMFSFSAERRKKEIGIRKVIGASVSNIVLLLSKDLMKLLGIANLIAWPIGYYLMQNWLQNFAYRIDLEIGIFVVSGFLASVVAVVSVGYQTMKAAYANPVDALRKE